MKQALTGELALQYRKAGGRKQVYGPEVIVSLRLIWAFFWYPCGKRLAPFMREQMEHLACWKPFHITRAVRGICGAKPEKLLKKHISVRTHYP
jgi:hypothetical protein